MTGPSARVVDIDTAAGSARAHVHRPARHPPGGPARRANGPGLVVLGHGAGGGVEAADLRAVTAALLDRSWAVARVEQPYRVAGRRAPDRAPRLDEAWTAVIGVLRRGRSGPLIVGGRSSGARVACRTAPAVGAAAVICLAFPLHPPSRPDSSRADELAAVGDVPLLVVQGARDPFGGPAEFPAGVHVVEVPGDHSLRRTGPVADAVVQWLTAQGLT